MIVLFYKTCFKYGAWQGKQKSKQTLQIRGGVTDQTILELSLSNRGRKHTAAVVKAKKAGAEKSRNRTHCGVEEEWAAVWETEKGAITWPQRQPW